MGFAVVVGPKVTGPYSFGVRQKQPRIPQYLPQPPRDNDTGRRTTRLLPSRITPDNNAAHCSNRHS